MASYKDKIREHYESLLERKKRINKHQTFLARKYGKMQDASNSLHNESLKIREAITNLSVTMTHLESGVALAEMVQKACKGERSLMDGWVGQLQNSMSTHRTYINGAHYEIERDIRTGVYLVSVPSYKPKPHALGFNANILVRYDPRSDEITVAQFPEDECSVQGFVCRFREELADLSDRLTIVGREKRRVDTFLMKIERLGKRSDDEENRIDAAIIELDSHKPRGRRVL